MNQSKPLACPFCSSSRVTVRDFPAIGAFQIECSPSTDPRDGQCGKTSFAIDASNAVKYGPTVQKLMNIGILPRIELVDPSTPDPRD